MNMLALIAGPTASGKSALALDLAERRGGIVINADASQVYRDLRVLTARPTPADEARVPHALYGHVAADESHSAARWAGDATRAIETAWGDGRLPVLVGGTGLYLRTLLDGIAPVPPIEPDIRAQVRAGSAAANHAALAVEDPQAAATLHANDTTRVARALEVMRSTGRPLHDWQATREGGIGARVRLAPLVLLPDRAELFRRCDARVEAMMEQGAVEEVRLLLDRAPRADAPVRRAIGVPEIAALLAGETDCGAAVEAIRLATRQYAKRQYTWFRNQPPAGWQRVNYATAADIERLL